MSFTLLFFENSFCSREYFLLTEKASLLSKEEKQREKNRGGERERERWVEKSGAREMRSAMRSEMVARDWNIEGDLDSNLF